MYHFIPPSVKEAPAGGGRLFFRYGLQRGISVLVTDGVVTEVRSPTQDEVSAADAAYIGGHEYLISDADAAPLLAAGLHLTYVHGYTDDYEASY